MDGDISALKDHFGSISAVIPCFNREAMLPAVLDSIAAQTLPVDDIIIVDDGSRDQSVQVAKDWATRHPQIAVQVLVQPVNQGANAARNRGFRASQSDWIAFLDSDDLWHPDKLEQQARRLLDLGPDYGFAYTGFRYVDDDGAELGVFIPEHEGDIYPDILGKAHLRTTSTYLVRKECLEQIGGFDDSLPSCQDWDLSIRLAQQTKIAALRAPLLEYLEGSGGNRISRQLRRSALGHMAIRRKYRSESRGNRRIEAQQLLNIADLLLRMGRMRYGRHAMLALWKLTPSKPQAIAGLILSCLARDAGSYNSMKSAAKSVLGQ
ncbi:MAG: glycosyltransferase [Marinobacter nauticus]